MKEISVIACSAAVVSLCLLVNPAKQNKISLFVFSVICTLGILFSQECTSLTSASEIMISIIRKFNINYILFPVLFYCSGIAAYKYVRNTEHKSKTVCIASAILALGMVVGGSYESVGSWNDIIGVNDVSILKSSIQYLCYYCIFNYSISCFYMFIDKSLYAHEKYVLHSTSPKSFHRFLLALEHKPFTISIILLIIFWLPSAILYYPGTIGYDGTYQILQGFGAYTLTDHFPICHILIMKICILFGLKTFDSSNVGLLLCNLVKLASFVICVSICVRIAVKYAHAKSVYVAVVLLYFCIHPMFHDFLLLIGKDAFYSTFFLTYFLGQYLLIKNDILQKKLNTRHFVFLMASIIMVMSLRNEGAYIVFATLIFQFIMLRHSRPITTIITVLSILIFTVINVFIPHLVGSKESSGIDKYSIQIQQISRCVSEGKILQGTDQKNLEQAFDVEKLRESYDFQLTDPSKSCIKIKSNDKKLFLKVWLSFLNEYPTTCLQATLHHNYNHLYYNPAYLRLMYVSRSQHYYTLLNDKLRSESFHCSYPRALHNCALICEYLRENIIYNNCFGIILSSSTTYVWLIIIMLFYIFRAKSLNSICLLFPVILSCVTLFLAPTGAHSPYGGPRYCLPLYFVLPFLFPITLNILKNENEI